MLVTPRTLRLSQPFMTEGRIALHQPEVAFEEYGNPDGPVIFVAHGGISNPHAAGRYSPSDAQAGWWDGLIGQGKALDTNRFRVIAANALGSMFGSTGPLSVDPATGKSFGPQFPAITLKDMTLFFKAFLDELNVKTLYAIAGLSMGSMITLQMAAEFPGFVQRVIGVASAAQTPPAALAAHSFMMNMIRRDQDFRDGNYGSRPPMKALQSMNEYSRLFYTHEKGVRRVTWDTVVPTPNAQNAREKAIQKYLQDGVEERIRQWDANSIITLLSAINTFDLGGGMPTLSEGISRIVCPVLIMNFDTDQEFSPSWGAELVTHLNASSPGRARFEELESDWGHLGCLTETGQMSHHIGKFLQEWDTQPACDPSGHFSTSALAEKNAQ
ncbi:MAG: alpha/beta fold hydrolase [Candidatus Ozemobacteraceae bacterium]